MCQHYTQVCRQCPKVCQHYTQVRWQCTKMCQHYTQVRCFCTKMCQQCTQVQQQCTKMCQQAESLEQSQIHSLSAGDERIQRFAPTTTCLEKKSQWNGTSPLPHLSTPTHFFPSWFCIKTSSVMLLPLAFYLQLSQFLIKIIPVIK